ncbi:hypothetical protein OnM2_003010 [Erysiphe neolycopersici]|uniref:Uncharacterized protein n=1 Tax=Erysiphe neolycopersici TaxID=212602 RepID=A0A420I7X4_9PEZI|nr:hypothetical protein OnM2_003010 [Erysiphe neolycopersici]
MQHFKNEEKQPLSLIIQNYFSCIPMLAMTLLLERVIILQKYSAVYPMKKREK